MTTHSNAVERVMGVPPFCMRNNEVTRINAAQPFMLMVVQMGNTNRDTLVDSPRRLSAVSIVTGSVAAELLVNSAMSTAGIMRRSVYHGFRPRARRNRGSTMKNCRKLPPMITKTYLPRESATTPADTCAESCAAKATMPAGSVHISPRMRAKSRSCSPMIPFMSVCFCSVAGILASAKPTAKAMSSSESTLPSRKGRTTLLGITPRMWS